MLPEMFYWLNIVFVELSCCICSLQKIFCEHLESLVIPWIFFSPSSSLFFCRFLTLGLQSAMACPIPMTSAWMVCVAPLPTFLQNASRRRTGVLTPNMMCTGQWTMKTPKYYFRNPKISPFILFLSTKSLNPIWASSCHICFGLCKVFVR